MMLGIPRFVSAILFGAFTLPLAAKPLLLGEVLQTVRENYPPLLGAWLQQDIANGRIRQAQGAFDPIIASSLNVNPWNYYDGGYGELMAEKPFSSWGVVSMAAID